MTACVLDSSAALAWVLPTEADADGAALLARVAGAGASVPGLWPLEVGNALLVAERRKRITPAERRVALSLLADLPIRIDPQTPGQAWTATFELAASQGLTLYDAAYLELAIRSALPLASLDRALLHAADLCGVARA